MALTVLGLLVLQFAVMAGANGLVYLPGKRSEVMLSGVPTLLILVASLTLAAASALYVIDHYDRRPNEAVYQACIRKLAWLAVGLYIAASLMEHLMPSASRALAWHVDWFDLHPESVRRLMDAYPAAWRPGRRTFLAAVGSLVVFGVVLKLFPVAAKSRWWTGLVGVSFTALGAAWLVHVLGEISSGRLTSAHGKTVMQWSSADPARFQALTATYLTLALFTLCLGLGLWLGAWLLPAPRRSGLQRTQ